MIKSYSPGCTREFEKRTDLTIALSEWASRNNSSDNYWGLDSGPLSRNREADKQVLACLYGGDTN